MRDFISKIEIKSNWDERVSWIHLPKDNCQLMEIEAVNKIQDFLVRNNSGSMIVSGDRGVGKTTSLINAVSACKDHVLPVYLNSLRLEACSENNEKDLFRMLEILKQLTKSLFRELCQRNVKVPIELTELLRDCEATKLLSKQKITINENLSFVAKLSTWCEVSKQIFAGSSLGGKLRSEVGAESIRRRLSANEWVKSGLSVENLVERFSEIIQGIEKSKWIEPSSKKHIWTIVKFKKWIIDLSSVVTKEKRKSVVFIIDELDLYDGDGALNIEPREVLQTLKRFKNLFTLSSAKFIFIVGKNTYNLAEVDPYRTLFTERCYLSIPDGNILSDYLDSLVIGKQVKSIEQWEEFKWYLISNSKHNLFDLVRNVNSFSVYNRNTDKLYLQIPKLTLTEKAIASFHFLLNTVFLYHKQDPILEHFNDKLFKSLLMLGESFRDFLLNGTAGQINSKIDEGCETKDKTVNRSLIDAKTALFRSLYSYLGKQAPGFDNPSQSLDLPWQELRQVLDFKKVSQSGIMGIITPNEESLMKNVTGLVTDMSHKFGQYLNYKITVKNLIKAINDIVEITTFTPKTEDVSTIDKAIDQILNSPISEREWELTARAVQSINAVVLELSRLYRYDDNLVLTTDWGQIEIDGSQIQFGGDTSHGNALWSRLSVQLPKIEAGRWEVKATVELTQGTLINFLFYTEYAQTEADSAFYMVRLDTREHNGDQILFKPKGSSWSEVPDNKVRVISSQPNKLIDLIISYNNGVLELKKKRHLNYQVISRITTDKKLVTLGIGNELGKVTVSSLKVIL